jgi:hypothetical protein
VKNLGPRVQAGLGVGGRPGMGLHQQRRPGSRRPGDLRVGGRVIEGVGRLAVPGRELDRLWHRHPGRVQGNLGPGQDVEATRWHIKGRHGRAGRGAGADERQAIPDRPKIRLERGVGNRPVREPTRLGVEEAEVVAASVPIATGEAAVSDERVAGVVELPGGVGELGRHRQQRLDLAVVLAV